MRDLKGAVTKVPPHPQTRMRRLEERLAQLERLLGDKAHKPQPEPSEHALAMLEEAKGVMLDVGCGASLIDHTTGQKKPFWVGIDIQDLPGVDIVHDIEEYPWPLPDACCHTVMLSHILEHINPAKFGIIKFMNEIWRVCKPGAQLYIACPWGVNDGFCQDPTHLKPINATTLTYFDPTHRTGFYRFYQPRPWKIQKINFAVHGSLEAMLTKLEFAPEPSGEESNG